MNLPFFIAWRYFFSKRKTNFINLISLLAMIGVAFSTAALIIVLSVFNGLGDLLTSLNNSFDPEIKIESVKGKSFEVNPQLIEKIKATDGVSIVTEVIEDYAYIRYRDADMVVTMRGVSPNYIDQHRIDSHIVDGDIKLHDSLGSYAMIGRGVQYALSIPLKETINPIQVFYIKNLKASLDPSKLYSSRSIMPSASFMIEKNIDENYILLPIDFVIDLMDYGDKRTSLEIKTTSGSDVKKIKAAIQQKLGDQFLVLTNDEQHKDIFRLLNIEKLFTFVALTLLIIVASINIFFSLMMLAIDKKKDISVLSAVGAQPDLIRKIFLTEGALIAFSGALFGLIFGGLICWAQDRYGFVGMGMDSSVVNSYPVKMKILDFVYVAIVIVTVTFTISIYPAERASKSYSVQQL